MTRWCCCRWGPPSSTACTCRPGWTASWRPSYAAGRPRWPSCGTSLPWWRPRSPRACRSTTCPSAAPSPCPFPRCTHCCDICRSVVRAGFSRILIVNGHGGNMTALHALTTELTVALDTAIGFASYFGAGREVVRDTLPRTASCTRAGRDVHEDGRLPRPGAHRVPEHRTRATDHAARRVHPTGLPGRAVRPDHPLGGGRRRPVAGTEKGEKMLAGCARALADVIVQDPWAALQAR